MRAPTWLRAWVGCGAVWVAAPGSAVDCFTEIAPEYLAFDPHSVIQIADDASAQSVRDAVVARLWNGWGLPTALPAVSLDVATGPPGLDLAGVPNLDRVDAYTVDLPLGYQAVAHHLHPVVGNGSVVIAHQGHWLSFEAGGLGAMTRFLMEQGYSVVTLMMPGVAPNAPPASHNIQIAGLQSPGFDPLSLFVEPVVVVLNQLELACDFASMSMVGVSGGGWTTTLAAALDPRIGFSAPVAGSLPLYLRTPPCPVSGDWEQGHPLPGYSDLYDTQASYLDLYILGGWGAERSQLQILNQFDGCCFKGITYQTYEAAVKAAPGDWDVSLNVTQSGWHEIADVSQVEILRRLGTRAYALDDDEPEVDVFGLWALEDPGYGRHHRRVLDAGGGLAARFAFDDVDPHVYEVLVHWIERPENAGDATYRVVSDGQTLLTTTLDQRAPPSGPTFQSRPWGSLGTASLSGSVQVDLDGAANGDLVVDAVALVAQCVLGDLDDNGVVAGQDLFLFLNALGTASGEAGFQRQADFDGDGAVAGGDLFAFLGHLGAPPEVCP